MEWEEVVQIICDSVKEHETRRLIYKRMIESVMIDSSELEDAMGIDSIFDEVAEEYIDEDVDQDEDDIYDDE